MAISAGTWVCISEGGLNQAINATSATQTYEIGKTVRCRDVGSTAYGEAEFVYRKGVASLAAGDFVNFDGDAVARCAARSVGPGGVAMAATDGSSWGWFQVHGKAKVTATAGMTTGLPCVVTASGAVDIYTSVGGDNIRGCITAGSTDTGFVLCILNYPASADMDNSAL